MGAADRPRRDPAQRKAKPEPVQPPPPSKPTGAWTSSKILTKNSGVVKADIRAFLLTCVTGWDSYTSNEQRAIIDTLPPGRRFYVENAETGRLTCPLEADFIANDPYLKRAVTRFTEDVSAGHYTTSWQLKARQAMIERSGGRFDEYMKQQTEDRFGDGEGSSARTSQEPGVLFDDARHGGSMGDEDSYESSDAEFDPATKAAKAGGSRSRESRQGHGLKRKTASPDSSPDPLQTDLPSAKRSRTTTPMDQTGDQAQGQALS
jgi:hypothetical protein